MTTPTPTPRVSAPAYYLGRPAALWQTALASRSTADKSARTSSAGTAHRSSPDNK
jgi:hypothetical protein